MSRWGRGGRSRFPSEQDPATGLVRGALRRATMRVQLPPTLILRGAVGLAVSFVLVCPASPAQAMTPVIRDLSKGTINWTTMDLCTSAEESNSSGSMAGYEALEGRARATLGPRMLDLAREVVIDSSHTSGDLMSSTEAVADKLDANVSLWEVTEARYHTSGRVEVEVCLPIHAWLRPALSRMGAGVDRSSPPEVPISGLIVDARGLELTPAISPEVRTATGALLYSAASMTSFAASQRAPVIYVTDPADPVAVRRSGEQPLIVRAASVAEDVNLVLDPSDGVALEKAMSESGFLAQGTVVIVVDR